ncbi:MAG TPA: hypothetical protein VED00_03045 [archaeon]|nr:hypothetical protein [archaeon]
MSTGLEQKNMESPKKVVSRNAAIALGVICILVLAALVGVYASYTSTINSKNTKITGLNSQITTLNTELSNNVSAVSSLNTQINTLNSELSSDSSSISSLNTQISNLNTEITSLKSELGSNTSTIASLETQITNLKNQQTNFTNIVNNAYSTTLENKVNESQYALAYATSSNPKYSNITFTALNYVGYLNISITAESKPNIYVSVLYTASTGAYNGTTNFSSVIPSGSTTYAVYTILPVIPGTKITVLVGNNVAGGNAPKPPAEVSEIVTIVYHY